MNTLQINILAGLILRYDFNVKTVLENMGHGRGTWRPKKVTQTGFNMNLLPLSNILAGKMNMYKTFLYLFNIFPTSFYSNTF